MRRFLFVDVRCAAAEWCAEKRGLKAWGAKFCKTESYCKTECYSDIKVSVQDTPKISQFSDTPSV